MSSVHFRGVRSSFVQARCILGAPPGGSSLVGRYGQAKTPHGRFIPVPSTVSTDSIDISFYFGGINLIGPCLEIRLFEWDGKAFRNITTNVDMDRKVVTGRTNRLAEYVIVTLDRNVQPGQSLNKK